MVDTLARRALARLTLDVSTLSVVIVLHLVVAAAATLAGVHDGEGALFGVVGDTHARPASTERDIYINKRCTLVIYYNITEY